MELICETYQDNTIKEIGNNVGEVIYYVSDYEAM